MLSTLKTLSIRVSVIAAFFLLYYFSIPYLISSRKSNSLKQAVFNAIDLNHDSLLSSKEIKSFSPCDTIYNKLNKKLARSQQRVTYRQFKAEATEALLKKTFSECARNVPLLTNRSQIAFMDIHEAMEKYFFTYDLDFNRVVTWKEYHTVNMMYKKRIRTERKTFVYIDKNQDWRVTPREFLATKFYKLITPHGWEMVEMNSTLKEIVANNSKSGSGSWSASRIPAPSSSSQVTIPQL